LPIELVYLEIFASRYEALEAERKIKKWGKRKKYALVMKGWNGIVELRKKK
jgi:predicted GIY-YIG superfamily endonuclease